ncbi:MAG: hypothetical protein ABI566_08845 [Pseudolysinimonas sp.]
MSARLPAIAALSALALVLTGCVGEEQTAVGVDEIKLATLGDITASQQAFVDRFEELSEGSVSIDVTENWEPSGGTDSAEVALAKAVLAGDIDVAWIPTRALSGLGVTGIEALEAPLLVQTHEQQKAVASGVPGEIIRNALRNTGLDGLALLPGPMQYPAASGAPVVDVAGWAGKTAAVGAAGADNTVELATMEALGATPSAGSGSATSDLIGGSAQVGAADLEDFLAAGGSATGPFLTINVPLWPKMSMIVINSTVHDRLSSRQNGFLDGAVVRAQDFAMSTADSAATVSGSETDDDPATNDAVRVIDAACGLGPIAATATADQLAAFTEAVKPVYAKLKDDTKEARLLDAIEEVVKKHAGVGSLPVPGTCIYVAPPPPA